MEFTNEIFFNKKLTAGSTAIITYCGKLYREHSQDISIVYGYGDNWENTTTTPMKETENGFEVTIDVLEGYTTFNFCFKNTYEIWDNNYGNNYITEIEPPTKKTRKSKKNTEDTNQTSSEEASSSSSTAEAEEPTDTAETEQEDTSSEVSKETDSTTANSTEKFQTEASQDIEKAFASLLDSILEDHPTTETINSDELSGYGLQSVDEVKEKDFVSVDEVFQDFYNELTDEKNDSEKTTNTETNYDKYEVEQLDTLMDNILNSIVSGDTETATPIETIETTEEESAVTENESNLIEEATATAETTETTEATESIEDSNLPTVVGESNWLTNFTKTAKDWTAKASVAIKKFAKLVKLKAQEYGIIRDDNE